MLVTEGEAFSSSPTFGNEIVPMSKTTFYFVIGILIITDIVQGRYQKKLLKSKPEIAIGKGGSCVTFFE